MCLALREHLQTKTSEAMKTFEEAWTKCSDKLPESGDNVWVIDKGGFQYPAWFFINANMEQYFASARQSIILNFKPEFWRPRT